MPKHELRRPLRAIAGLSAFIHLWIGGHCECLPDGPTFSH